MMEFQYRVNDEMAKDAEYSTIL